MDVEATSLHPPPAYGRPTTVLTWDVVERTLAAAPVYWLVTTRADARPHAVPVDGVWSGGAAFLGGDPATVHERNLRADPRVVPHTESPADTRVIRGGEVLPGS